MAGFSVWDIAGCNCITFCAASPCDVPEVDLAVNYHRGATALSEPLLYMGGCHWESAVVTDNTTCAAVYHFELDAPGVGLDPVFQMIGTISGVATTCSSAAGSPQAFGFTSAACYPSLDLFFQNSGGAPCNFCLGLGCNYGNFHITL